MPEHPSARSVKIGSDERTGWSSERPRRDGAVPRPVDISARCRVLAPSHRMRYSPGSLAIVVGPARAEPVKFVQRVVEERGAMLAPARVRAMLTGRVPDTELEERAGELLTAAVVKRLQAGETVVVPLESFDPAERERFLRLAHGMRRPRHLILLDAPRDQVSDDERPALDDLRRALDAGEVGLEGFQTAVRLGGAALTDLKRIVFQPAPRED
ncbi:MAG: ATP-binding protein [Actinomycetota bacterium]|nr:ATP-binding protein [Actinomycetota bacterium]